MTGNLPANTDDSRPCPVGRSFQPTVSSPQFPAPVSSSGRRIPAEAASFQPNPPVSSRGRQCRRIRWLSAALGRDMQRNAATVLCSLFTVHCSSTHHRRRRTGNIKKEMRKNWRKSGEITPERTQNQIDPENTSRTARILTSHHHIKAANPRKALV